MKLKTQLCTGEKIHLKQIETDYRSGERPDDKEIKAEKKKLGRKLEHLQEKLFASGSRAVLFVFQGMDCSGKDGTINHVFSEVNPQGVLTHSFKAPTDEELNHDYLWRAHRYVPERGYIGAFNRSYYEDVLITRVHGTIKESTAQKRFKQINDFERMLSENGVTVVKIFLHISKRFQLNKLIARIENPNKNWKFDPSDLAEREHWDKYQTCYEDVLTECASKKIPWYVVPADDRTMRDLAVLQIAVETLEKLDPAFPPPVPELQHLLPKLYEEQKKY
ncbi:PPK2 family polyphosphate kinase [Saccharibacillus kuerlensis]|uniref:PPK2 family polyphosphate--nucleotide phosphotransferase n=1 Tax=Saccharibacillus kuerlensis TaxID=459527 RepID=A0ABQ2KQZ7_9BACL|nr:PPK2 family polyphosphate kinase [Saccharibacillus kuerlensis]GGN90010.1 PPK2 family polyphosphate--nucleotide phosphotransferase [Saccharibacillus kuerlensis]